MTFFGCAPSRSDICKSNSGDDKQGVRVEVEMGVEVGVEVGVEAEYNGDSKARVVERASLLW